MRKTMTKQEQIKEITQIICRRSKDNFCLIDKNPCDCNCGWARYAEVIYNEGCRKADEIRKETAQEILQCLYDKCYEGQNLRECFAHIIPLDILTLAKEYGVEVKE